MDSSEILEDMKRLNFFHYHRLIYTTVTFFTRLLYLSNAIIMDNEKNKKNKKMVTELQNVIITKRLFIITLIT